MTTNRSSISKANNLEKMGELWDKRDFTDFDNPNAPDVEFHVTLRPADESFSQGWKEALNNEILPIVHLWNGIKSRYKK